MMNLPPQLMQQPTSHMDNLAPGMEQEQMWEEEEPIKILAHFTPNELKDLDKTGSVFIDPETGLRDLSGLEEIFKIPEIQEAISEAMMLKKHKKFAEGGHAIEEGRPIDPELEALRLEGRGKDTELAIITPGLAEIFDQWSDGKTKTNPMTGFPEYGLFSSLFRIVAPIVGAVFGGPLGATLAGGLSTKLTGGSWGDALKSGALSGIGSYLAPGIGGAFQKTFPGISSALGQGTRAILGNTAGGALGNLFTPSSTAPGILGSLIGAGTLGGSVMSNGMSPSGINPSTVGINTIGRINPSDITQKANQGLNQEALQGVGSGFLSSLLSPSTLIPLGGAALMLSKGHKQDKLNQRNYENKQIKENEDIRNKLGFYSPLKKPIPFEYGEANFNIPKEDLESGKIPRFFNYDLGKTYAAEGGAIIGNGKGQQDNINKNIKEGSYIIDASSVSDIGDGSTQAGFQELDKYFSKIPSQRTSRKSNGGYIRAMVSDGEYEVSPEKVTAIGSGSNERGAMILKKLIQEVRNQKRTSGKSLPPKSKSIGGYLQRLNAA